LTLLCVFAGGLLLDLGSKELTFRHVAGAPIVLERADLLADPSYNPIIYHAGEPLLPFDLLNLRLVLNPGAVFGIGANQRWFFIGFTVVALLAGLYIFGRHTTGRSRVAHVALGLILAGGLGNLHDRIVYGRVRDFLHMLPGRRLPFDWTWPGTQNQELFPWVFNVADVLLLVGMIGLMVHMHRTEARRRAEEEAVAAVAAPAAAVAAVEPVTADVEAVPEPPSEAGG
jgi:lipoprotein signal peptidase